MRRKLLFLYLITFLPFYLFTLARPIQAARLYFEPGQESTSADSSFTAGLYLDTEGRSVTAVDVVLEFDDSRITINSATFTDIFTNSRVRVNDNGRFEATAYFIDLFRNYKGRNKLATISFNAGSENSSVDFICQAGETTDTNILELGGEDIVNCASLGNLRVAISEVSPSPTPTPSPSPDDGGTGGPADSDGCDMDAPDRPTGLMASSGPGRGQVSLRWNKVEGAIHYAIAYGERWLDFDYGAANVGDTDQFIVNGLKTNTVYFFVLAAVNGCASSGWSDGASAYAGWGAVAVARQTIPSGDKGWEPPEEIDFKTDEDEATEGAKFEATPSARPSPKPYYEPPTSKKPWQDVDFWKKLGWILLVLFLLWLMLGFLRRKKKNKKLREKIEKDISDVSGPPPPVSPPPPF